MIVKERKIPIKILKLQALLRRLPANHPNRERMNEDLVKNLYGYRGEESLDYYLSYLNKDCYYILHDLRLQTKSKKYFQIDTFYVNNLILLITPTY